MDVEKLRIQIVKDYQRIYLKPIRAPSIGTQTFQSSIRLPVRHSTNRRYAKEANGPEQYTTTEAGHCRDKYAEARHEIGASRTSDLRNGEAAQRGEAYREPEALADGERLRQTLHVVPQCIRLSASLNWKVATVRPGFGRASGAAAGLGAWSSFTVFGQR